MNARSVAQLVFTLATMAPGVAAAYWAQGKYLHDEGPKPNKANYVGVELWKKTIGIIGFGAVGASVAYIADSGYRMRVLAYDPYRTEMEKALVPYVTFVDNIEDLLKEADLVTLHTPLNKETQGFVDEALLSKFKKGAILVNAARKGLVVEDALRNALQSKWLRGAATDDDCSFLHPNHVSVPHLGASTDEAEQACAQACCDQLRALRQNGTVRNGVNYPDVVLPWNTEKRITIANRNELGVVAAVTQALARAGLSNEDSRHTSIGELGVGCGYGIYNVQPANAVTASLVRELRALPHVLRVRVLERPATVC